MSTEIPEEWYFITAPQSVSWSKDSRTTMIEPYGTNNPYVHLYLLVLLNLLAYQAQST